MCEVRVVVAEPSMIETVTVSESIPRRPMPRGYVLVGLAVLAWIAFGALVAIGYFALRYLMSPGG
jgi:hypothetical protein